MFFGSFDVFMHVFKKSFYKDVKTCFYVFYLQINVFLHLRVVYVDTGAVSNQRSAFSHVTIRPSTHTRIE